MFSISQFTAFSNFGLNEVVFKMQVSSNLVQFAWEWHDTVRQQKRCYACWTYVRTTYQFRTIELWRSRAYHRITSAPLTRVVMVTCPHDIPSALFVKTTGQLKYCNGFQLFRVDCNVSLLLSLLGVENAHRWRQACTPRVGTKIIGTSLASGVPLLGHHVLCVRMQAVMATSGIQAASCVGSARPACRTMRNRACAGRQ